MCLNDFSDTLKFYSAICWETVVNLDDNALRSGLLIFWRRARWLIRISACLRIGLIACWIDNNQTRRIKACWWYLSVVIGLSFALIWILLCILIIFFILWRIVILLLNQIYIVHTCIQYSRKYSKSADVIFNKKFVKIWLTFTDHFYPLFN